VWQFTVNWSSKTSSNDVINLLIFKKFFFQKQKKKENKVDTLVLELTYIRFCVLESGRRECEKQLKINVFQVILNHGPNSAKQMQKIFKILQVCRLAIMAFYFFENRRKNYVVHKVLALVFQKSPT
jgi:hypothetical protein